VHAWVDGDAPEGQRTDLRQTRACVGGWSCATRSRARPPANPCMRGWMAYERHGTRDFVGKPVHAWVDGTSIAIEARCAWQTRACVGGWNPSSATQTVKTANPCMRGWMAVPVLEAPKPFGKPVHAWADGRHSGGLRRDWWQTRACVGGWALRRLGSFSSRANPCMRGRMDEPLAVELLDGGKPVHAWADGAEVEATRRRSWRTRARVGGWRRRGAGATLDRANPFMQLAPATRCPTGNRKWGFLNLRPRHARRCGLRWPFARQKTYALFGA
jgi:hypothetical protein